MNHNNPFFKKNKKVKILDVFKILKIKHPKTKNYKLNDIKELDQAKSNDITFFNSIKYIDLLKKTKSKFIITTSKYKNLVSKNLTVIAVDNVFLTVAKITELFYPNSLNDSFDENVSLLNKKKFKNLKFGKNILVGKNVKIGKNCTIGHNTIIESNVKIGSNCKIGCNVTIKNTIIDDNVNILDGAVIGKLRPVQKKTVQLEIG